jgi:hypothetical protein
MAADPVFPPHPLYALTTYELRDFRCELEHRLKSLSADAPAREQLQQRLQKVRAEQDERRHINHANPRGQAPDTP